MPVLHSSRQRRPARPATDPATQARAAARAPANATSALPRRDDDLLFRDPALLPPRVGMVGWVWPQQRRLMEACEAKMASSKDTATYLSCENVLLGTRLRRLGDKLHMAHEHMEGAHVVHRAQDEAQQDEIKRLREAVVLSIARERAALDRCAELEREVCGGLDRHASAAARCDALLKEARAMQEELLLLGGGPSRTAAGRGPGRAPGRGEERGEGRGTRREPGKGSGREKEARAEARAEAQAEEAHHRRRHRRLNRIEAGVAREKSGCHVSVAVLRDRVRTLEEANRELEGEDLCRAHHAVASLERENLFLRELLEPFLQLDEAAGAEVGAGAGEGRRVDAGADGAERGEGSVDWASVNATHGSRLAAGFG